MLVGSCVVVYCDESFCAATAASTTATLTAIAAAAIAAAAASELWLEGEFPYIRRVDFPQFVRIIFVLEAYQLAFGNVAVHTHT